MKPITESEVSQDEILPQISGDVIGDTAYSERFVLKLMMKFAELDVLKDVLQEKSFEEDLCTLWDMTAERDVVQFLQKHKILNLFNYALPDIDSSRTLEIIVGIIANMCCQKEVVEDLLEKKDFLTSLLDYISHEDSLLLIQVLRLVSASLFLADDVVVQTWMDLLASVGFPDALYFILKNSSHKNLLINAMENLNTVCSYCNTEKYRATFFTMFVKKEAIESLSAAVVELTITQPDICEKDELERILVISLEITLNLIGFDQSLSIYSESKEALIPMIEFILKYYNNKIVNQKEIDIDLADVIDSTVTIVSTVDLSALCSMDKFFDNTFSIWLALQVTMKTELNGSSDFEDQDKEQLSAFTKKIESPLCTLMCKYMEKCSEDNLKKVLDTIGTNLDDILKVVTVEVREVVSKRAHDFKNRIENHVDS